MTKEERARKQGEVISKNHDKWVKEVEKTKRVNPSTWQVALMRAKELEKGDPDGTIASCDKSWAARGDPDGSIMLSNMIIDGFKEAGAWAPAKKK